ncbi:MAG: hypothetical protein JWO12_1080 [Frankiales bacterium]|nr:hypothetical protein [Frankiales bacterium]
MDLMTAVKTVLGKYADFSGRARRSEYWYWTLAVGLAIIGLEIVALVLAAVARPLGILVLVAVVIVGLGAIVPGLAVGCRRLHDTGKSGWLLLLGIIPFGGIVVLVFMVMDSTPGDNQYGPNPKGIGGYGQAPMGYGPPPTQ